MLIVTRWDPEPFKMVTERWGLKFGGEMKVSEIDQYDPKWIIFGLNGNDINSITMSKKNKKELIKTLKDYTIEVWDGEEDNWNKVFTFFLNRERDTIPQLSIPV